MQRLERKRKEVALYESGKLELVVALFKFAAHRLDHSAEQCEFAPRRPQTSRAGESAANEWNQFGGRVAAGKEVRTRMRRVQERAVANNNHARAADGVGIVGATLDRAQQRIDLSIGLALRVGGEKNGDFNIDVHRRTAGVAQAFDGKMGDRCARNFSRKPHAPRRGLDPSGLGANHGNANGWARTGHGRTCCGFAKQRSRTRQS